MAQNKKPRKKRAKKTPTIQVLNEEEAREMLSHAVVMPSEEETEIYDTPCGTILINADAGILSVKSKILRKKLVGMYELNDIDDDLEAIIAFERLKVNYPNEPHLYQVVASFYKEIDRKKYKTELEKNYALFPEYPRIATTYAAMFANKLSDEEKKDIVGNDINIHKRFPKFKSFDVFTVVNFLSVHAVLAREENDFEKAMKCAETVTMLHPEGGKMLTMQTKIAFDKGYKRKAYLKGILTLIVILGIICAIIYGIVTFFQWIF